MKKDLTKELFYTDKDATSVKEVKELFERLFKLDWTIDIYRNKKAQTFNLSELGWTIGFGSTKTSAGRCRWKWRTNFLGDKEFYGKRLELSLHYLSQEQNLVEGKGAEWEEVIRHELAHAIDLELRGKSNHDRHWKAVANAMLSTGERTFSDCQLKDEKQSKYTLVCENGCGKRTPSHRKKKRQSSCGDCSGGRFNPKYILTQVQNY